MNTKHTPGPWTVLNGTSKFFIRTADNRIDGGIGSTTGDSIWDEANAKLIAAAPELLEALEITGDQIQSLIDEDKTPPSFRAWGLAVIRIIERAIAKAEGESCNRNG